MVGGVECSFVDVIVNILNGIANKNKYALLWKSAIDMHGMVYDVTKITQEKQMTTDFSLITIILNSFYCLYIVVNRQKAAIFCSYFCTLNVHFYSNMILVCCAALLLKRQY